MCYIAKPLKPEQVINLLFEDVESVFIIGNTLVEIFNFFKLMFRS